MAERYLDPVAAPAVTAAVAHSRRALDAEGDAIQTTVERNLPAERAQQVAAEALALV